MNLNALEKKYRDEHLSVLEVHFRRLIYSQFDTIERYFQQLETLTDINEPEKFFKKLTIFNEPLKPLKDLSDLTELRSIIDQFPESMSLPITERHRKWMQDDSIIVKLTKSFKQLRFVSGNKNQMRTFEYRYLIGTTYIEFSFLSLIWQKALFGLFANFLDQSKVQALNMYSNNATENSLADLVTSSQKLVQEFKLKAENQIQEHLRNFNTRNLNNLQLAGTYELARTSHSKERYIRNLNAFSMDLKESAKIWGELISVNVEQLKAASTLIKVNQYLNSFEDTLQAQFSELLSSQIRAPFEQLKNQLTTNFEALKNDTSITKMKLEALCDEVTTSTHQIITDEVIAPLNTICDERVLSKKLDLFASDVALLANRVEDSITLVEDLKYNEQLPEYSLKPIQWQSLFRRILGDEYLSELLAEDIHPEKQIQLIIEDFSEVDQIINTNLSIAQDVDKNEGATPYDIVKKGLELSLIKLLEIEEDYPKIESFLIDELEKHQHDLSDRISKLLIDQDAGQIKREDAKIKVRQSASDFRNKLDVYWAKSIDRIELGRRFLGSKIRELSEAIRSFLGLKESEHINVQKTNIAALLHDIDLKYRQLPYIYRRLFDFKRPAESSFFIKHQAHVELSMKAYELWKSDFPSSIAILGEKGSGRTTQLNYLINEVFATDRVEQINFSKTIFSESDLLQELSRQLKVSQKKTTEEFVALLSRRRRKSVVVVENLQNCFLRSVNGYEAINALLYLISETKDNVLWVCSSSKYAWNFLNVAVKVGDYFSHSIMVDNQPSSNISEIINKRQVASGYQLEIIPDASVKNSRAYKKLADDEEKQDAYLLSVLFERLNKMAEGNATVAMIYWIRCIQKIESAEIVVELKEIAGIEYLSDLDSETLFVLSAFVLHDVLNAEHLGQCLNYSNKHSETIISRLCSRGLLVELENGFSLNDLIYRQVVRLLSSRNFINA